MKPRAANNRTTYVTDDDRQNLRGRILQPEQLDSGSPLNTTINGAIDAVGPLIRSDSVDLLFLDPPYNLDKNFGNNSFKQTSLDDYADQFESWLKCVLHTLKPAASVYVCCDWMSSPAVFSVITKYLTVRNRITWEREKGRGAKSNWKNNSEDIWFATVGTRYKFNVESVMLKKRIIAPYRTNGEPKGWSDSAAGKFRLTYPSNLWTDITVPFWSMPENTDHPTQKPEKLVAKAILASTDVGDVVFDPFLGSGTTSVVCKKLDRAYIGSELNEDYCYLTEKRLAAAAHDTRIQGYEDGVFWERNSLVTLNRGRQVNTEDAGDMLWD